ncbi:MULTISPECIES: restriction endonuclease subunit S [unclassified Psychrobacter]|uniref:restriction endonuclease subunit S n=1 Tax=unclassified Psychrobacter TaxID=196806 RepID=UPI003FD54BFB
MVSDWVKTTLGKFTTLQRGHDLPSATRISGNIPILGSFGITGWHNESKVSGPGVTVGRSGASYGVVSYSEVDYWPLNTALFVKDFHGNHPKFAYYFLKSMDFERYNSGSAVQSLNRNHIHPIEISIPPLPEQKAIAHILGSLDDKIELNRQMNETLEAMAQALFKSWFVDFDPVIDNALAAGNAIPDEFMERAEQRKATERKDNSDIQSLFSDEFEFTEEMGWIPRGWLVKNSGDLFDVRDGTHDSPKKSDEGKYLITSRHITSGVIDYPNAYLISQDDFDEVNKRSLVESYDILITMIGTVGVSMLVLQDEVDFAIKNVGLFKTSSNKSYAVFFYLYLNSNYMTQFLDSRLAGTTQKYLTLKVLRALPVVTPDDETLSYFVNNISPIFKKIHSNHEQMGTLSKLRDTLLPKLMSGELRISDAAELVDKVL